MKAFLLLLICLLVPSTLVIAQENSSLPGAIAYIGIDSNIFIYDLAQQNSRQITTDGSTIRRYQWPTWSSDGRLAYFCCDLRSASSPLTSGYVVNTAESDAIRQVFQGNAESVIYASWAPSSCGMNCFDLMLLVNNVLNGSLYVQQVRDQGTAYSSQVLAQGQPFYFAWSPDSKRMAFHRNSRMIDVYSLDLEATIPDLQQRSSGAFQAPAWSPVDDRILFGAPSVAGSTTNLIVATESNNLVIVENLAGFLSFLWSPDGNYIAYRAIDSNRFGALFVVDAISGELIARTTSDVIAFFWSPDSQRIAYITPTAGTGAFSAQSSQNARIPIQQNERARLSLDWSVLDLSNGVNRRLTSFVPTSEMLYLIQYFDQFAASHRIWSPSSTHLLYSELVDASEPAPVISILNITQADTVPFVIDSGVFAVWTFR